MKISISSPGLPDRGAPVSGQATDWEVLPAKACAKFKGLMGVAGDVFPTRDLVSEPANVIGAPR